MFLIGIMRLSKLELINFRNYKKIKINLNKNINIFIGNNGQGKTNILEAIYILAITKSHRYGDQINLIRKEMELAKIKGILKKDRIISDLEINISKNSKKISINSSEIKKLSDYITNMNVIMFTPDDLDIIKGSPQIRRNLLNIEISQLDKNYVKYLNEYNKILKMRNEYLKTLYINNIGDKRYLDIITDNLIDRAIYIYKKRFEFIEKLNNNLESIYYNITGYKDLKIIYNSLELDKYDEEYIKNKLKSKFESNYKKELAIGSTLYGPHRDDLLFKIGDDDVRIFSSQGGQRLAVVALKLAEIPIFKEITGYYPILLLDDIFSEIDGKKRNKLIKYINNDFQTIITTTDLKNVNKKLIENAKIFEVFSGNIRERDET